jgi:hypothetical protein
VVSQTSGINLMCCAPCAYFDLLFLLKFVLTLVVILANRLQLVVLFHIYLLYSILLASRKLVEL